MTKEFTYLLRYHNAQSLFNFELVQIGWFFSQSKTLSILRQQNLQLIIVKVTKPIDVRSYKIICFLCLN